MELLGMSIPAPDQTLGTGSPLTRNLRAARQPLPRPSEKQHAFCMSKCMLFDMQNGTILRSKMVPF